MKRARGFTLIELMITVAIVGVMVSVAMPLAQLTMQRSKEQDLRAALRQIREGIDAYKKAVEEGRVARRADETGYPRQLDALVDGVEDLRATDRRKIYFMRRLPRDPFADNAQSSAESWGKRSYASPPEAPAEGIDVYDVYSRTAGIGLNGIPYREW